MSNSTWFNKPIVWSYTVLLWCSRFNFKANTLLRWIAEFQISRNNFCEWTYTKQSADEHTVCCKLLDAPGSDVKWTVKKNWIHF